MIWFGEKFNRFHLSNFKTYARVNSSVLSYKHINLHFTMHWCRLRLVFIFICGKVRQMKSQKMNKISEFSFSFSSTVRNGLNRCERWAKHWLYPPHPALAPGTSSRTVKFKLPVPESEVMSAICFYCTILCSGPCDSWARLSLSPIPGIPHRRQIRRLPGLLLRLPARR